MHKMTSTAHKYGTERSERGNPPTKAANHGSSGQTLADSVRFEIEALISDGRYPPGTRLDEQEVAQRFGVSRTPVREAIRLLAASNLVELRGRQGAIVRSIRAYELLEMFQVMAELEGLCARLAARRLDADERKNLQDIHARLVEVGQSGDINAFYEVNLEFHEAIVTASRNAFLAAQTRQLRNRIDIYRRRVTYSPNRLPDTIDEHGAILSAIVLGDGEAAHRLMREHVSLLGDVLLDFLAVYD